MTLKSWKKFSLGEKIAAISVPSAVALIAILVIWLKYNWFNPQPDPKSPPEPVSAPRSSPQPGPTPTPVGPTPVPVYSEMCDKSTNGSYSKCTTDSDCCCVFQTCQDGMCQGQPETAENYMTHYWDCCKPSCAYSDKGGSRVYTCDASGENPTVGSDSVNLCDNNGDEGMCKTQYPWIENNILYGYVALSGDGVGCGDCYEVEFTNARNIEKAIVMVTNGGDSSIGNMDLAVPGGGFGANNGCALYGGWDEDEINKCTNNENCATYGGFYTIEQCAETFAGDEKAVKACEDVLFGVFGQTGCDQDSGYPSNIFFTSKTKVTCPAKLTDGVVISN